MYSYVKVLIEIWICRRLFFQLSIDVFQRDFGFLKRSFQIISFVYRVGFNLYDQILKCS